MSYKHLENGKIEIEYLREGLTKKIIEEKSLLDRFLYEVESTLRPSNKSDANVKINNKLESLISRFMLDRIGFSRVQNDNKFFIQNLNPYNSHNKSFEIKLCLESSANLTTSHDDDSFKIKLSSLQVRKLRRLDTFMPLLVAWISGAAQENKSTPLSSVAKTIAETKRHDKRLPFVLECDFVRYKLAVLFLHIILGTFSEPNQGEALNHNHPYIFLKMNGELVCFHQRNLSEFSEYLFNSALLEKISPNKSAPKLQKNDNDKTEFDTNIMFGFALI